MQLIQCNIDDHTLEYALQLRKNALLKLYIGWEKNLQSLDIGEEDVPEWGPLEHELADARHASLIACVAEGDAERHDRFDSGYR